MDVPYVSRREIDQIIAVAQFRSFTDAAHALHLSQSALSRAVNEVERRLSTKLFTRTTRSVEITPTGMEFLHQAEGIRDDYARRMSQFLLFRDGSGGVVRVAALPSIAASALSGLVARLHANIPEVVLDIDDTLAHLAISHVIEGRADLAVTVDDGLPAEVVATTLATDRFRVVYRPDHPFHGRTYVRWEELAAEPIIAFSEDSSLRTLTDRTFAAQGLSPHHSHEARNIAVVAGLVAAGLGVAAAPTLALPLMQFAQLESAELISPVVDRSLVLLRARDRPLSPAADRVMAEMTMYFTGPNAPEASG